MGWFLLPCFVHCFFHLLLFHFPLNTSLEMLLCDSGDSSALLQFKNSFAVNTLASNNCFSSSNKTASWKNGTNCCQWDGVTCDTISGHVIGLDLSCSNLQGALLPNSTLFHLTHFQKLNLAFNDFSGSLLYSAIGDLVNLTHLNLSYSSFHGDIPSTISHLSKLVSLDLTQFYYTRDLRFTLDPYTWDKLILNATNLEELVLNGANMSLIKEGSLTLLMNLSSTLVSLHMGGTELQGNFPSDILSLPNLQELSLFENEMLGGELPNSNWSNPLRLLDLSFTTFSGKIPSSIGHLKSLDQLFLTNCRFDGLIPLSLWNLTQLTILDLSGNTLNGEIPSLLSNLIHLTALTLVDNNFNGQIPDVFGWFIKLEYLELSSNNLGGQLPPSLFDLTQLFVLDISNNKLVGPIPNEINKLSKLSNLRLSNNSLNRTIPHWCFSLSSLVDLELDDNQFTGPISEFSTYSLSTLFLSNNKIEGKFPSSIFEMKNLTYLSLSSNNLSGPIDFHQFSKLQNLQYLYLSHNKFHLIDSSVDYILPNLHKLSLSSCNITNFPKFLTRLQDLILLDLSNNKIHGKIPKWFNNLLLITWKRIQFIDLSFNKLEGDLPIPPYFTQFFSVSNNNLTGDISSALCSVSSLETLILSHNNLTGMIPQCMGTLPYLTVLNLQMNNLYGSIPGNFFESNSFKTIQLNGNRLQGPLPQSLANCTMLQVLDLGDNNIEDVFPNWLETLQELLVLILRGNKFHGNVTSFSAKNQFPKLKIFDVSNNNLNGPLPTSYFKNFQGMMNDSQGVGLSYMDSYSTAGSYYDSVVVVLKGVSMELVRILTTFTTIDLSNNLFDGEIPQVIGELKSLKGLNLSHNAITGTIPQSLGNLTGLEWLDLSWNQLRGEIPMALTNLNFLSFLNLSQNQLEGVIPTGKQFNTFQNDSYGGNPMLCGISLSKSCSNHEERPPSTFHDEEKFGFGWKPVAVGYACGVVFGMLLGCCFFLSGKPLWLARLIGMPNKRARRTNNRAHANRRRTV